MKSKFFAFLQLFVLPPLSFRLVFIPSFLLCFGKKLSRSKSIVSIKTSIILILILFALLLVSFLALMSSSYIFSALDVLYILYYDLFFGLTNNSLATYFSLLILPLASSTSFVIFFPVFSKFDIVLPLIHRSLHGFFIASTTNFSVFTYMWVIILL